MSNVSRNKGKEQKIKRMWHKSQVKAYAEEKKVYERYTVVLQQVLEKACRKLAPLAIVQARPKALSSFAEKALRKRTEDPVHDFTDLCGARIITQTQEEVEAVCKYIRENFVIDEINSDDKKQSLAPTEFGYLSVHYIVQLPDGEIDGIAVPEEIGNRKAEIQVRTLLQHAWSAISHDSLYKNQFEAPERWHRDMARLAAILEETDEAFGRFVKNLAMYATEYGYFMPREKMESEIDILNIILENQSKPEKRQQTALRMANIYKSEDRWSDVISVLLPYEKEKNPRIIRELGYALCRQNAGQTDGKDFKRGQRHLIQSIEFEKTDPEAHAYLAWSWEATGKHRYREKARKLYSNAYSLKPTDPYYLASYLGHELSDKDTVAGLELLKPVLESAICVCRSHAEVGIEIPRSLFTMGKFYLFLGEGFSYASLQEYTRAIYFCLSEESGISLETLKGELEYIEKIGHLRNFLPAYEWVVQILRLALHPTFHPNGGGKVFQEFQPASAEVYEHADRVTVVAGSCRDIDEERIKKYEPMLRSAFEDYRGIIVSGGTKNGIAGLVGRIPPAGDCIKKISYMPKNTPSHVTEDRNAYMLSYTEGKDFSPLEPLQMWNDILTSGIKPLTVKLLGIGGGKIAAFEYRLALMLGAYVALIEDSGRAVDDIFTDIAWRSTKALIPIPPDRMSLKAFLFASQEQFEKPAIDDIAKAIHEDFIADSKHKITDPSMVAWDELLDHLKDSNRQQALFMETILQKVGFGLRKKAKDQVALPEFAPEELELMAEMEHGRWNVERLTDGWKLGPRDTANKTSPHLVSWKELPDEIKDYDRKAVKGWPAILRGAEIEIYPIGKE